MSTHQLAEMATKQLADKATLEEVLITFNGIGKLVRIQLGQSKGVRLTGLGTFTLSAGDIRFTCIITGKWTFFVK